MVENMELGLTSFTGRKKFVMLPGNIVPPGVIQLDEDNYEAPTTVIQWFVKNYQRLEKGTYLEAVVHPGEVIYVPSGWWHTVLNLDETVAVTQNFVDHVNYPDVCGYLNYHKPELYETFIGAMEEQKPEAFKRLERPVKKEKSEWEKFMEEDDGDFVLSF